MDAACTALNILAYWAAWGFYGIALWGLLDYAVPRRNGLPDPLWTIFVGIVSIVFVTGVECAAVWACLGDGFEGFAPTIPTRVFVTALVFVAFMQFYKGYAAVRAAEAAGSPPVPAEKAADREIMERITLRVGGKIKIVEVAEIEYLQAEGDYVAVVTAQGRWLKEQTMKYFEEHLPESGFVRVHRSYIVGVSMIARIERYGNLYQIVLRSGDKIKVSANGYKLLKERMNI